MPVQSTSPSLTVTRPEIYFGEMTNTDVYVKTRQQEFNYPQGQTNSLTSYEGTGGIVLGGFLRRLLIALDRGDLAKLPFSDDVTADEPAADAAQHPRSRRDAGAVPHLRSRSRTSSSATTAGCRGSWTRFTTSDTLSLLARLPARAIERVNYVRNSVKAVDRRLRRHDDVLRVRPRGPDHRRLPRHLPDAVQGRLGDAGRICARTCAIRRCCSRCRRTVYGLYHMTNPEVFYNREDLWTVRQRSRRDASSASRRRSRWSRTSC